jgi:hypothetical protein
MRSFASILTTMLVAAALPSAAFADYQYTFQVPATLSNVPAGAGIQVECNMWAGPNRSGAQVAAQTSGNPVTATNGTYSGTFVVKASSTTAPGSYACWLLVSSGNSSLNIVNGTPANPSPGWTGTMMTGGNLPVVPLVRP